MLPHLQKLPYGTKIVALYVLVVCSVWYTSIPHTTHYRHYKYPADVVGTFNFLLSRIYIHRGILVALFTMKH